VREQNAEDGPSTIGFDRALLSRIEDAGLNAATPPQQRWFDGWLIRLSAGKAKRARCVNALAEGQMAPADKLRWVRADFEAAGLPLIFRITPFTRPASLDSELDAMGFQRFDDTRVMVCAGLPADPVRWRAGSQVASTGLSGFAQAVGELRGSPLAHRQAHAQRLELSPVRISAWVVRDTETASVIACGQFALEHDLVGLYDVFVAESHRGQGLAGDLCRHMLLAAEGQGARVAYLQVDAVNTPARRTYQRLGFADAYAYHYRAPDPASSA
jgi:ribosomal protein S18 acetylase RimI-like enzyme